MLLGVSDEADKTDELTSFIDSRRCSCIVMVAAEVAAAAVAVVADVADTREVTASSLDSCCCCSCCRG